MPTLIQHLGFNVEIMLKIGCLWKLHQRGYVNIETTSGLNRDYLCCFNVETMLRLFTFSLHHVDTADPANARLEINGALKFNKKCNKAIHTQYKVKNVYYSKIHDDISFGVDKSNYAALQKKHNCVFILPLVVLHLYLTHL